MSKADDVRAKMPCSFSTLFYIIYHVHDNCVEPWCSQIDKLVSEKAPVRYRLRRAVIYGMYPELEEASKEWYSKYQGICNDFKNNSYSNADLEASVDKLTFQIGEQYGLNKNRYLFNEMTEEQAKRVQERKDIEIKNVCNEEAEMRFDPIHIVMQGLCEKLDPKDCEKLIDDFRFVEVCFRCEKGNDLERIARCKEKCPERYSIYEQIKNSLEVAGIKDCDLRIDHKNYQQFAQTLENFKYKGKEYNLVDVVKPITQKRAEFGEIVEIRVNTFSQSKPNKRVLGG